jgi:class III poly(R)-hydroxyalkanoic acid synthase PhaE subunit
MSKKDKANSMDWNEQADSMMKSWAQAQKDLWESWAQMMTETRDAKFQPPQLFSQWQEAANQYMDTWMGEAASIAQTTASQFLGAQELMLRFTDFNTRMWQAVAPKIEAGEDWQPALEKAIHETSQSWLQTSANLAGISGDMSELWQLYLKQWESFGKPWDTMARHAPALYARAAGGDRSAMQTLGEEAHDAYQRTLGRLVASPNLGMARDFNRKLQEGFDAWVGRQMAYGEYTTVLAEIWDAAFKKFSQDLLAKAQADEKITSVRDLTLLWTRGAEEVFTQNFRSEAYVLAQGKVLNASMEYRLHEREIIEEFLKIYDLPTRSELDEAHRRIYELRREVKVLKKAVAQLSAAPRQLHPAYLSHARPQQQQNHEPRSQAAAQIRPARPASQPAPRQNRRLDMAYPIKSVHRRGAESHRADL